jgi:hypothetical protein
LAINILELQQGWRIRRRFVRQIDADETRTAAASAAHGVATSISDKIQSICLPKCYTHSGKKVPPMFFIVGKFFGQLPNLDCK